MTKLCISISIYIFSFKGHSAPVTGLSTHNGQGSIDFSHLFLTSSIDWTVKLWSLKENRPLHSFETNGDYVYDVAWSPIHPALFAAVDGTGRLDLWNLNRYVHCTVGFFSSILFIFLNIILNFNSIIYPP